MRLARRVVVRDAVRLGRVLTVRCSAGRYCPRVRPSPNLFWRASAQIQSSRKSFSVSVGSVYKQDKEGGGGRDVKRDVRCVRDKPITTRQETVGLPEHDLETSGTFGFWVKEIGYPPCSKLSHKDHAIADPKPYVEPMRVRSPKVQCAEQETDGERRALN